ncbi:glycosyltransferase family A protein [Sinosporangium siamense]|uniref:Glycosyl transferase n=1 Tax=Sinosporangium siamense TaxID=1367973 RepID=A0A919RJW8_9ACTN|nr:glycosyltransferase family A protein [Sinosporangium siamense]GII93264.1 glycosyl transferase [Sinosporangium siamense]
MSLSAGVVIPTVGDRPDQLTRALRSVLDQVYPGRVEVIVVVDGGEVSTVARHVADVIAPSCPAAPYSAGSAVGVACPAGLVRVLPNRRGAGVAGARNTGIAALSTELVAFCDDDDEWLPGKLSAQVLALTAREGAEFVSCAIEVVYGSRRVPRLAGTANVTAGDLARSRMMMVHSSTFVFRRGALWVDESAPAAQNEDWDLALRAAKRRNIVHVDTPLVRVHWGTSHYVARWADRIAGLEWMLARHPELAVDPRGAARIYGQLAFHHAALGHRRAAGRWAWRAFTTRRGEPRAPIALAVAARLIPARVVLNLLHTCGRGI